jgi:hypothetical protein
MIRFQEKYEFDMLETLNQKPALVSDALGSSLYVLMTKLLRSSEGLLLPGGRRL